MKAIYFNDANDEVTQKKMATASEGDEVTQRKRQKTTTASEGYEVTQYVRHDPPSTYSLKISSFSLLARTTKEFNEFKSSDFAVEGYKWNLLLKPNDGHDHISLYLAISDPNSLPHGWEVIVVYRLFVYDQIRDNYLTIGDAAGRVRRFHCSKTKYGFSQLMSLKTFVDPANGFLVDDACEFGVEVFIVQKTSNIESLTLKQSTFKHYWTINKFSELKELYIHSDVFTDGVYKWKLQLYPRGLNDATKNCLSLFLILDYPTLGESERVYAAFTFYLTIPSYPRKPIRIGSTWIDEKTAAGIGYPYFMNLDELRERYLVNDTLNIEAEIIAYGYRKHSVKKQELKCEGVKLTCPICMDNMKQATSTSCGHVFCNTCITEAIRRNKKCPTCRKKLSSRNILQIYLP